MKPQKIKWNGLEVMRGNRKIGSDTLIFNLGSAHTCPSRKRGLCKLGDKCYALKAELMYPGCRPYRDRQANYWLTNNIDTIITDFDNMITAKRTKVDGQLVPLSTAIKYIRLNESGDLYSQTCLEKAERLASYLWTTYQIQVYTYTARSDLDYSAIRYLTIKGSGHDSCPNGVTIARPQSLLKDLNHAITTGISGTNPVYHEDGKRYLVCPMSCFGCDICKTRLPGGPNVVFALH